MLGLAFGLLGGWFGAQLLPPVYGSLRAKKFSELTF